MSFIIKDINHNVLFKRILFCFYYYKNVFNIIFTKISTKSTEI